MAPARRGKAKKRPAQPGGSISTVNRSFCFNLFVPLTPSGIETVFRVSNAEFRSSPLSVLTEFSQDLAHSRPNAYSTGSLFG